MTRELVLFMKSAGSGFVYLQITKKHIESTAAVAHSLRYLSFLSSIFEGHQK